MSEPNAVMLVRNYLIERDEALAPGEADDDERMESAREIVEGVRKSLSASIPAEIEGLASELRELAQERSKLCGPFTPENLVEHRAASALLSLSAELETVKGVSKTAITHANERYGELDASFRRVVAENADLLGKLSAAEAKLAGGEAKLTQAQSRLLERIAARGGAIQRKALHGQEVAVAWRLVDAGKLIVDGASTSSRGPFNQAAQDTLTFVVAEDTHPVPTNNEAIDIDATAEKIARHLAAEHKSFGPTGRIHEPTYNAAKEGARLGLKAALRGEAS